VEESTGGRGNYGYGGGDYGGGYGSAIGFYGYPGYAYPAYGYGYPAPTYPYFDGYAVRGYAPVMGLDFEVINGHRVWVHRALGQG